ncbi:MAG: phosphodiester glycosidase family protein, partial [Myxococcota bacterium]
MGAAYVGRHVGKARKTQSGALAAAALVLVLCAAHVVAQDGPGITVERIQGSVRPPLPVGDGTLTLVRVDMRRYRLRFLTEERHGPRRSAPEWMREHGLTLVTNAGMFLPNGRSVGHMVQDGDVVSARRVGRYRGTLAFGPRRSGLPELTVGGSRGPVRGCTERLEDFIPNYRNVLQAYTLLDCQGRAVQWRSKRYSSAAMGVDSAGRAVFFHSRTPYRMSDVSRMLAEPSLGLRGMIYLEGGPEASLV